MDYVGAIIGVLGTITLEGENPGNGVRVRQDSKKESFRLSFFIFAGAPFPFRAVPGSAPAFRISFRIRLSTLPKFPFTFHRISLRAPSGAPATP